MSVENFGADGYGDTSGLVYGYENAETGDTEIRKLIRSRYGEIGSSPGDIRPMSSTKSTLDDQLPQPPLPIEPGRSRDDCGEDIPAFACEDCGSQHTWYGPARIRFALATGPQRSNRNYLNFCEDWMVQQELTTVRENVLILAPKRIS